MRKIIFFVVFLVLLIFGTTIRLCYVYDVIGPYRDGSHNVEYGSLSDKQVNVLANLATAVLKTVNEDECNRIDVICPIVAIGTNQLKQPFRISFFGYGPIGSIQAEKFSQSFKDCVK